VFTEPLHSNGSGAERIENAVLLLLRIHVHVFFEPLPRNALGVHVTIWYLFTAIRASAYDIWMQKKWIKVWNPTLHTELNLTTNIKVTT
jgi:hypothetical protein